MRARVALLILVLTLPAAACGDDGAADIAAPGAEAPVQTSPPADPPESTPPDDGPVDDVPADDTDLPEGPILGAGPYPIADLTITVQLDPEGDAVSSRLSCLGDTATLSGDPVEAPGTADSMCLALNELPVHDRIVLGVPEGQACTQLYGGPEVVTIVGTLDGVDVDTEILRTDGCGIGDWDLLGPLLPMI